MFLYIYCLLFPGVSFAFSRVLHRHLFIIFLSLFTYLTCPRCSSRHSLPPDFINFQLFSIFVYVTILCASHIFIKYTITLQTHIQYYTHYPTTSIVHLYHLHCYYCHWSSVALLLGYFLCNHHDFFFLYLFFTFYIKFTCPRCSSRHTVIL